MWSAEYAQNTGHHRATDNEFLGDDLRPGDVVLDIGSGAGDLTRAMAALVDQVGQVGPPGRVIGVEPSAELIAVSTAAAEQGPAGARPEYVHGRAQDLADLFPQPGGFDAVVSKAALHWLPEQDHPRLLRDAHRLLRPGGLLRLEFGGADNVAGLTAWLDPLVVRHGGIPAPWFFTQPGHYLDLVLDAGFDVTGGWVRAVAQRRSFDRDGVVGLLRSQVLVGYCAGLSTAAAEQFTAEVIGDVDRLRRPDGSYDVTFVRMDVRAARPGGPARSGRLGSGGAGWVGSGGAGRAG